MLFRKIRCTRNYEKFNLVGIDSFCMMEVEHIVMHWQGFVFCPSPPIIGKVSVPGAKLLLKFEPLPF